MTLSAIIPAMLLLAAGSVVATGIEYATKASGFTGSTVTYGSVGGTTGWISTVLELDNT